MHNYILLANPGHNRIYLDAALKISRSELMALSQSFSLGITEVLEGMPEIPASLKLETEKEFSHDDLKVIASSSIFYALFKMEENGLLKPIPVPDFHTFPESMVQILKYNGKTNEQFTRLMVNLALSACETPGEKKTLLDPMAGKGTTLFEGLIRGMDVKGIELHDKWAHEAQIFLQRFMKEGRYKHKADKGSRYGEDGRKYAELFDLVCAADPAEYKAGNTQTLQLITSDTRAADLLIKNRSCDMIVADLPYGVQHGSKTEKKSRSPLELLEDALPAWDEVLKAKGSIVMAFNEYTLRYNDLALLLKENGYTVLKDAPYSNYSHRVDQSIKRNIIVAVK